MKKRLHTGYRNHIPSIRFRRWSRTSYAVFSGLKKNITIGQLSKGVIDRLFLKTNILEIIVPKGSHLSLQQKSMEEILSAEGSLIAGQSCIFA